MEESTDVCKHLETSSGCSGGGYPIVEAGGGNSGTLCAGQFFCGVQMGNVGKTMPCLPS